MKKFLPLVIVIVIVVVAGAFYGGMLYSQSQRPSFANGRFGQGVANFNGQRPNGQNGASVVSGQILSKDEQSITVQIRNAGSKIIFLSDSTSVGKFVDGTAADLTVGENVMVNGTTNSDGSVSATSVQIRPATPDGNSVTPPNLPPPAGN